VTELTLRVFRIVASDCRETATERPAASSKLEEPVPSVVGIALLGLLEPLWTPATSPAPGTHTRSPRRLEEERLPPYDVGCLWSRVTGVDGIHPAAMVPCSVAEQQASDKGMQQNILNETSGESLIAHYVSLANVDHSWWVS
jgi:hypothetical protein